MRRIHACRAAFAGDTERLLALLADMLAEKQTAFDPQGNTVGSAVLRFPHANGMAWPRLPACTSCLGLSIGLNTSNLCCRSRAVSPRHKPVPLPMQVLHIAVLRQNQALTQALVDSGFGIMHPNSRGWQALDEAVSLKNRELVSTQTEHGLPAHAYWLHGSCSPDSVRAAAVQPGKCACMRTCACIALCKGVMTTASPPWC